VAHALFFNFKDGGTDSLPPPGPDIQKSAEETLERSKPVILLHLLRSARRSQGNFLGSEWFWRWAGARAELSPHPQTEGRNSLRLREAGGPGAPFQVKVTDPDSKESLVIEVRLVKGVKDLTVSPNQAHQPDLGEGSGTARKEYVTRSEERMARKLHSLASGTRSSVEMRTGRKRPATAEDHPWKKLSQLDKERISKWQATETTFKTKEQFHPRITRNAED